MSIFNSLGSNYNLKFVLKALFNKSKASYSNDLKKFLEDKYNGEAFLFYKGREAIELALKILKLPGKSFVAINGFTCFAVYEAIKKAGLNVEYLDIERGQLNFSAENLHKKLTSNPKIKVVIVQNTLGYPCQIDEVSKICKENKIILIEDLAHCVGTKYSNGQEAGMVGDMTVLSFSQDKMIDGISGGALIVRNNRVIKNNKQLESDLKPISQIQQTIDMFYPFLTFLIRKSYSFGAGKTLHFIVKKLNLLSKPMGGTDSGKLHELPGWYSKLITWQFENLESNLNHRKKIAYIYADVINPKILSKTILDQIDLSSNLRFPVFVNKRQDLIEFLENYQIYVSDIWYDAPIAPKKYLDQTDYQPGLCPNAQLASDEIINLPTHINISKEDAQKISHLINQWLKSK